MNLTWNPLTREHFPFSDISHRPYSEWGFVNGEFMRGYGNSHWLETSFTKRYSDRGQMQADPRGNALTRGISSADVP
jgi:hypothetical protein